MSKEVTGVIKLAWNLSIALPLSDAHKMQALLTKALLYTESGLFARTKFGVLETLDVPPVEVTSARVPIYDATMLTHDEAVAWRDAVRASFDADEGNNAANAVDPENWKKMKGA